MGTTSGALAAVVAISVFAALLAYWVGSQLAYGAAKSVASVAFVGIAVFGGALTQTWSTIALVALVIATIGDVALAFPGHRALLLGMALFIVGYLTLSLAFFLAGFGDANYFVAGLIGASALALLSWTWLQPHLNERWRPPTAIYHVAIALMLATGIAAALAASRLLLLAGVIMLALSDIAVARERFVSPGLRNKVWGLPVYYAGMVLVALSIAAG